MKTQPRTRFASGGFNLDEENSAEAIALGTQFMNVAALTDGEDET